MSETSESYHIRTTDPKSMIGQLRAEGLAGIVFYSDAQWLTFVPYDHGGNFPGIHMDNIVRCARAPVFWYLYSEDYGWGFRIAGPEFNPVTLEFGWNEAAESSQPDVLHTAFKQLDLDAEQITAIDGLLAEAIKSDVESPTAYRIAAILKLPAYKWLSPNYVTVDTDDFVKSGGRRIGRKPKQNSRRIATPANRTIKIPDRGVTAREAFEFINPIMTEFGTEWFPVGISCSGIGVDRNGRLRDGTYWTIDCRSRQTDGYVTVDLWPDGRLFFKGEIFPDLPADFPTQPDPIPLPAIWMDSSDILPIVLSDPEFMEFGTQSQIFLRLDYDFEIQQCI